MPLRWLVENASKNGSKASQDGFHVTEKMHFVKYSLGTVIILTVNCWRSFRLLLLVGKGSYRMKPVEPEVETAVLSVLRGIQVWPCFARSKRKIGRLGTRIRGYWNQNIFRLQN